MGKKPAKGKMLRLILTSVIRTKVRLLSRNNTIQDNDHILKGSAGIPFDINNKNVGRKSNLINVNDSNMSSSQ